MSTLPAGEVGRGSGRRVFVSFVAPSVVIVAAVVVLEDDSSTVAVMEVPESFLCRIEAIEVVSVARAVVGKDKVERVMGEVEEDEDDRLGASIRVDVAVVAVDAFAMDTSFGGRATLAETPSMEGIDVVVASEVYSCETREGASVMMVWIWCR